MTQEFETVAKELFLELEGMTVSELEEFREEWSEELKVKQFLIRAIEFSESIVNNIIERKEI